MNEKINTLQQLVFGDRNTFVFLENENIEDSRVKRSKIAKFLLKLSKNGYAISNADMLLQYSKEDFKRFKSEFFDLVEANSKEGFILRKTFAESEELTEYTAEEWLAIFAQYSITYGWGNKFEDYYGSSAQKVLGDYVDSLPEGIADLKSTGTKTFSISDINKFKTLLSDILGSSAVLRAQQIKTLEATPKNILAEVAGNSNITIKETLVKTMTLCAGEKFTNPILKTSTDVLRFCVQALAHNPLEGQLTKTALKDVKLKIPTSMRKVLLQNLEVLGTKKGAKFLTEDMFTYADFWKRLDKYLRFTTSEKTRTRYPNYTEAIDLLYVDDRSWTFNGRFSQAKEVLDYDRAIRIAAERPGFLLRNLQEFLRSTKGSELPQKKNSKSGNYNPLQARINGVIGAGNHVKVIQSDASDFLKNDFKSVISKSMNNKLAWQLLENLENPEIFEEQYSKVVQGVTVNYDTPVPGADKKMVKHTKKAITKTLADSLHKRNTNNIYVDDSVQGYKISYSGRSSVELSYAGEFLSPGTSLSISEIMESKGIKDPLLRCGIMWRGSRSVDIDHSLTVGGNPDVYYGSPTLKKGGKVLITSSGDITSCGATNFSTELVDIDISACLDNDVLEMVNSANVFSGPSKMGNYEVYYFLQVIERKDRVTSRNSVKVDLAKMDYAIRVDPDNTESAGAYIGFGIDLKQDKITALNLPVKQNGVVANVRTNEQAYKKQLKEMPQRLSIKDVIEKSFDKEHIVKIKDADIVVSRKSRDTLGISDDVTLLHPGRDAEKLQELYF